MVGKINNMDNAISSGWKNINDSIWIIGSKSSEKTISASSYLEYFHGQVTGRPPKIDLEDEKYCQFFLRLGILKKLIISAHDLSDGGLAVGLSECCILSSKGATISLKNKNVRADNTLFSEGGSRIIFSVSGDNESSWLSFLNSERQKFTDTIFVDKIGVVSNQNLNIKLDNLEFCNIGVDVLTEKFNNSISNNFL